VRIHRGADGATTITFDRSVVGSQTDADETDGSLAEGVRWRTTRAIGW